MMKQGIKYYRPGNGYLEKGTFIDALTTKVIKINHHDSNQAQAFNLGEIIDQNHHNRLTGNHDAVIEMEKLKTLHIISNGAYPIGELYSDNNRDCINIPRDTIYFL